MKKIFLVMVVTLIALNTACVGDETQETEFDYNLKEEYFYGSNRPNCEVEATTAVLKVEKVSADGDILVINAVEYGDYWKLPFDWIYPELQLRKSAYPDLYEKIWNWNTAEDMYIWADVERGSASSDGTILAPLRLLDVGEGNDYKKVNKDRRFKFELLCGIEATETARYDWKIVGMRWTVVSLCETSSAFLTRNYGSKTHKGDKGEEPHGGCDENTKLVTEMYSQKYSMQLRNAKTGEEVYHGTLDQKEWDDHALGYICKEAGTRKPVECVPDN